MRKKLGEFVKTVVYAVILKSKVYKVLNKLG